MRIPSSVLSVLFLVAGLSTSVFGQTRPADQPVDTANIDKYMLERIEADKYPSLSIGIVHDQDLVYAKAYGIADRKTDRPAAPETIYRIGSATKVFTTTLLCILRDKGVVRLDDPASKYLPADVRLPSDPRGAPAITLRHLATHTSGLPRVTSDIDPKAQDPYAGCTVQRLFEILPKTPLLFPIGDGYSYSNLGVGSAGCDSGTGGGRAVRGPAAQIP